MNRLFGAAAVAVLVTAAGGPAWGGATAYDLSVLLDQPHPMDLQIPPRTAGVTPLAPEQIRAPARVPPPPVPPRPAVRPTPQPRVAQGVLNSGDGSMRSGRRILSEIRAGVFIHDEGPFSRHEESGVDGNLEFLFVSPDFLDVVWSPRPHFGFTLNSDDNTHQVYLGLSWEWTVWRALFAGFSLGGSVHSGHLVSDSLGRKELGCRLLFRESVELGYRFAGRHGVSVFLDHISNANICDKNEGLENFGVRYGYRF